MKALPRTRAKTPIGILKAVVKAIREEPKRYNQHAWISAGIQPWHHRAPDCGTRACIGGWVCVLTGDDPRRLEDRSWGFRDSTVFKKARRLLRLTEQQASRLFTPDAAGDDDDYGTQANVEAGVSHITKFMRDELGYTGPDL